MTAPDESTGDARIDQTMQNLAAVADASPAEQVAPLTETDRVLRETLDSIGDV